MSKKQRKPIWLIPYSFVVLMIVALILEGKDGLPGWANEVAGIGIVIIVFGAIALWVHFNTATLLDEEMERSKHEKITITEYLPIEPRENLANQEHPAIIVNQTDQLQKNQITHYRN